MPHKFSFRSKKLKKLNIASRVFIISLALFLPIPQTFAAIDNETLKFYAKNNILYYDPTGSVRDCTSSYSAKPSGNQITWIGDSYSVSAKSKIEEKLPGVDFGTGDSYIKVGKTVEEGLSTLSSIGKDNLKPYLVFALGTNGLWNDTQINKIANPESGLVNENTKIILVTSRTENGVNYTDSNKRLKLAAENNKNIFLADWASDSVYKAEYYASDPEKIHPYDGLDAWVNVIYNALPGGSAQTATGSSAQEIIWSFFINQGFNEIQVAGIMGNAYTESNFTPSAHSSDNPHMWGLFQWTDQYPSEGWNRLYPILQEKGYSKYIEDRQYWKYLSDNAEGKLMPIEDLRGMLEVEMQFAMEYGGAAGKSWIDEIKKADTIPLATEIFLVKLEGATGLGHNGDGYISHYDKYKGRAYQDVQKRITAAEEAYSKFTGYEVSPGQSVICDPTTINADPGDALAFLQQYVRDINYFYDANAPTPTSSAYYKSGDPSTYTAPMPGASTLNKTNLNNSSLSQDTKNRILDYKNCFGGATCRECTALSGWFVTMFTNYKYGGGHGVNVTNNLFAKNQGKLTVSSQPTPWSIFSYSDGYGEYGHTGVVIDVLETGEIITIENNLGYNGGKNPKRILAIVKKMPDSSYSYVDLRNGLDLSHLGTTYAK